MKYWDIHPSAPKKNDHRFCANPICACHEYIVDECCLQLQATKDGEVIPHFDPKAGARWIQRTKNTYMQRDTFCKVWFCEFCAPSMEEYFAEHKAYPPEVEPFVIKER